MKTLLKTVIAGTVLAMAAAVSVSAQASTDITVYGQSDIFLAGQTTVPSFGGGAGFLPPSYAVSGGETLNITATGLIGCCGSANAGPDGSAGSSSISGYGNVGAYNGVILPLVGVFNVGTSWSVFVIGSSLSNLLAPVGATELYLGIPDAFGFNGAPGYYADNPGSFDVTISATGAGVPEPSTWAMLLTGLFGLGAVLRLGRRSRAAPVAA